MGLLIYATKISTNFDLYRINLGISELRKLTNFNTLLLILKSIFSVCRR